MSAKSQKYNKHSLLRERERGREGGREGEGDRGEGGGGGEWEKTAKYPTCTDTFCPFTKPIIISKPFIPLFSLDIPIPIHPTAGATIVNMTSLLFSSWAQVSDPLSLSNVILWKAIIMNQIKICIYFQNCYFCTYILLINFGYGHNQSGFWLHYACVDLQNDARSLGGLSTLLTRACAVKTCLHYSYKWTLIRCNS